MLHNETRNLLIQAYNKTHNAKEVAECFSVDVSTVYRLVEQMKREGSVSVKTSLRGRKASLKEADLQKIQELVQQKPDITLHASEQERPRCTGETPLMERDYVWHKC